MIYEVICSIIRCARVSESSKGTMLKITNLGLTELRIVGVNFIINIVKICFPSIVNSSESERTVLDLNGMLKLMRKPALNRSIFIRASWIDIDGNSLPVKCHTSFSVSTSIRHVDNILGLRVL